MFSKSEDACDISVKIRVTVQLQCGCVAINYTHCVVCCYTLYSLYTEGASEGMFSLTESSSYSYDAQGVFL